MQKYSTVLLSKFSWFRAKTINQRCTFLQILNEKKTVWKKVDFLWRKIYMMLYLNKTMYMYVLLFSVRLVSVLCGHSVFSSPPQRPMTSDFLFSYLKSWERASISLFNVESLTRELLVPFYNVFGMTRPLIEPGTSRTRCQHSTTRLSRRWFLNT